MSRRRRARWPLLGVTVIHRYGRMQPGDNIVLVVTASAHRAGGVRGGRIPDGLSEDARAVLEAGGAPDGTNWVEAKDADDDAARGG